MQINIQLATSKHLEQIVTLIQQTSSWLKTKGIYQWSENFPISRLEQEIFKGELFVILDQNEFIMGALCLSKEKGELWPADDDTAIYLNRLVISRKFAGCNLGSQVVTWAKTYSTQLNIKRLRLNCDKKNPFLPGFYIGCGFKPVGEYYYSSWNMTFELFETLL